MKYLITRFVMKYNDEKIYRISKAMESQQFK